MGNFAHLHVHTEYSKLDGAAKHEALFKEVNRLGQTAVAMTDHGNLYGAYGFHEAAMKAGVKPIIGIEAYFAPNGHDHKEPWFFGGSKSDGNVGAQGAATHMTLLAKNEQGLQNLYKLHELSFSEGFYRQPRIDLEMLTEFHGGLIALSGCAGSYISSALRTGHRDMAVQHAVYLRDIFKSDFYIEVMDHGIVAQEDGDGFDEASLNAGLHLLADELGLPVVATNDSHYVTEADAGVHDALLCIQTQAKLADQNRFRFTGSGFYLKSRAEMDQLELRHESLDATLEIAEKVTGYGSKFTKTLRMPRVPGTSSGSLRALCLESHRFTGSSEQVDRLNLELGVISDGGFEDYFLVLADAIKWARANGVFVGPGRGSAGGSLVAYFSGITDIDPIEHGLLFERFLNPERISLPDIDVDFSDKDKVIEYLAEKHGKDNVAQIMTFGTIAAKAALKDANRISGGTYAEGAALTEMLPPPLFGVQPDLSKMPPVEGAQQKALVRLARGLEGLIRNTGVHAAGVVVSPTPLSQVLPVWQQAGKGPLLTGFDAGPVEALGLVKMDFLGVRNLSVIQDCLEDIGWTYDQLLALPLDDPETLKMLAAGYSDGVFQLDSDGMQRLLKDVNVSSFNDISAVLALYRPGPMGARSHVEYAKRKRTGNRRATINYEIDDILTELLEETYGVIVYQEQVMAVLRRLCGWSLGKADLARKAMGKKDHGVLAKLKPEFYNSMASNGYSSEASDDLWAVLLPFADYAFNKSHTVGYGLVSYWTAYLKCHHGAEYMASLLSSVSDDPDRLPGYLAETRRMGIPILSPDVNDSLGSFTATSDGIRFGICAIKGVGQSAYDALVKKRPYKSVDHFYRTASLTVLNIGVLNALVRSGAMDSLEPARRAHSADAERLSQQAREDRTNRSSGRVSLLRRGYSVGPLDSATGEGSGFVADWENEYLGLRLSYEQMDITLARALTDSEWGYVAQMIDACPGDSPVNLWYNGHKITTGHTVDTERILEILPSVMFLEISDGVR
jgi:DNA polymerase-3 subunit alpha